MLGLTKAQEEDKSRRRVQSQSGTSEAEDEGIRKVQSFAKVWIKIRNRTSVKWEVELG